MSLLGILGVGSQLFTAGANVAGAYNQIKTNDLNYKLQKKQLDYQKGLQQIMFDRDGQMFCNGRKKVPTWDGNPTHYMVRYGSGLGGANGYITFSY